MLKLSVSFSEVLLRHVTVVASPIIILDALTCRVEVKLEFREVPLTLMRVAINGPRGKGSGGIELVVYLNG